MQLNSISIPTLSVASAKFKAYFELLKFRLSFLVAFSGGIGFVLASTGNIDWIKLTIFAIGGFLITGSSNIINQIIEKDLDKLMKRTLARPLPTNRLSITEATIFSFIIGAIGLYLLVTSTNVLAALLTIISSILYGFVYTPLKRKGPIAVFVGAICLAVSSFLGYCLGFR